MYKFYGDSPGLESELDRWNNEGGAGNEMELTYSERKNAKVRLNADFDRLSRSIAAPADRNVGLLASEIAQLLEIVEQKRSEQLSAPMTVDWVKSWEWNGRAHSFLLADARAKAIYKARDERRRVYVDAPVRYFGFKDEGGFRVFNFGRLPQTDGSPTYRVSVSLSFFRRGMALQDGPGFCASILSRRDEPDDCVATLEDVDSFLASRAPKSADKGRTTSRTQSRYDG